MVSVEPIQACHFDDLYDTFLREDDPRVSRSEWQRLFEHNSAECHDENFGYRLIDDGRLVGMLGMLHSQREIDNRLERFCNLHSWFVHPTHRGYSMLLMRPILKLRDCTLTDLTPTHGVRRIAGKLGFHPLDSSVRILLPFWGKQRDTDVEMQWNGQIETNELTRSQQRLFQEQTRAGADCLLAKKGREKCFIVCRRIDRHWRPYCYILHLSDSTAFASQHAGIRKELLKQNSAKFIAVDDRLIGNKRIPGSLKLPVCTAQLYRSSRLTPSQIDPLYTEVALLGLTTFPSVRAVGAQLKKLATLRRKK